MPTQELKFDFDLIAKIKEAKQHQAQPCYDERYYPARLNYGLYGEVLKAKFIRLHGHEERVKRAELEEKEEKPKGLLNLIKWLAA